MLPILKNFLRSRGAILGVAALCAVIGRVSQPAAASPDVAGLTALLKSQVKGQRTPEQLIWEPSRGSWLDAFYGRRLLFLSDEGNGRRDVYRAWVRVAPEGAVIGVDSLLNLTRTAEGDDVGLIGDGERAAFATVAFGGIQSVSVLELAGIRAQDRPGGVLDRLMLGVTALQEFGTLRGVGRTDVKLQLPIERASLSLSPHELKIGITGSEETLHYGLADRRLTSRGGVPGYDARATPKVYHPKPFVFWAVDSVRAEVGPEPIAWLENRVFGAKDAVRQASYRWLSGSKAEAQLKSEPPRALQRLDASGLGQENWPPSAIPSLWKEPRPGEGQWQPVTHDFLRRLPGAEKNQSVPPYFYQTFIRPDAERPYSTVTLIAMDMRQLELRMQAGFEDPRPTTGPPGDGRLPTDPGTFTRVVATFNGAFKTTHGEYGMMVDRRVLVPPVQGGATVITDEHGGTGLGSWPQADNVPESVVAFRQNLDPLVEDGKANPTGRYVWGWQLEGQSVMTHRTALCVTAAGHLYYAFGEELDGPTLGRALAQAGCTYGVHLDMNPGHCGFVYSEITDLKQGHYKLALADADMRISPDKFVRWSAKDFFYVLLRTPGERVDSGADWEADEGAQPRPEWLPGIFRGLARAGNVEVALRSFEPDRVDFRVRAGRLEPSKLGAPPKKLELSGPDAHRVVASIGLGHTTQATQFGLVFGREASLPLRDAYATLLLPSRGPPKVVLPGSMPALAHDEEAVQLPVLALDSTLTEHGRRRGALRDRGALCVTERGRVLVASATHDSNDLIVTTLLKRGCTTVLALDRGSHDSPFVHRAGTSTPPLSGYDTTALYALGGTMKTTAYRWLHDDAVPSTKPTSFDLSKEAWIEIEKNKQKRTEESAPPEQVQ